MEEIDLEFPKHSRKLPLLEKTDPASLDLGKGHIGGQIHVVKGAFLINKNKKMMGCFDLSKAPKELVDIPRDSMHTPGANHARIDGYSHGISLFYRPVFFVYVSFIRLLAHLLQEISALTEDIFKNQAKNRIAGALLRSRSNVS